MTLFFPVNASSIAYEFRFFANSRASETTKLDGMDSWYMRKHGYNVFLRMYLSVVVSVPHSQVRIMFGQCWYGLRGPCHWFRSCQEHLHHLVLFVSHLYFTNRYVRTIFLGDFSQHHTKKLYVPPVWEMRCRGPFGMCWMRCTHWKNKASHRPAAPHIVVWHIHVATSSTHSSNWQATIFGKIERPLPSLRSNRTSHSWRKLLPSPPNAKCGRCG